MASKGQALGDCSAHAAPTAVTTYEQVIHEDLTPYSSHGVLVSAYAARSSTAHASPTHSRCQRVAGQTAGRPRCPRGNRVRLAPDPIMRSSAAVDGCCFTPIPVTEASWLLCVTMSSASWRRLRLRRDYICDARARPDGLRPARLPRSWRKGGRADATARHLLCCDRAISSILAATVAGVPMPDGLRWSSGMLKVSRARIGSFAQP